MGACQLCAPRPQRARAGDVRLRRAGCRRPRHHPGTADSQFGTPTAMVYPLSPLTSHTCVRPDRRRSVVRFCCAKMEDCDTRAAELSSASIRRSFGFARARGISVANSVPDAVFVAIPTELAGPVGTEQLAERGYHNCAAFHHDVAGMAPRTLAT